MKSVTRALGCTLVITAVPVVLAIASFSCCAVAEDPAWSKSLLTAYPDHLEKVLDGVLVWRDGTRMEVDDGKAPKPFEEWLENPDIEDMFALTYGPGDTTGPPGKDFDPGRARNDAFFKKMYGDCRTGEVEKNLKDIVWLPSKAGEHLKVTAINGVADHLDVVSHELDLLPRTFDRFLFPSAGTYNCRVIAGTDQVSGHGYGFAIDIAVQHSHYWRWAKPRADGGYAYQNEIPMEIVRIFEKHGFIWGGKWYHYDTMHFEYRPELLAPRP